MFLVNIRKKLPDLKLSLTNLNPVNTKDSNWRILNIVHGQTVKQIGQVDYYLLQITYKTKEPS